MKPPIVEEKARQRLRTLAVALRSAAKHPGKSESIHDLRVSIRRFRQMLRVFDGVFKHSAKMRHSLRGIMDLCGAARNCDIAAEVLAAAGAPADPRIEKRVKQRRARAGRELVKLLHHWHAHANMRRWRGWLKVGASHTGQAQALPRLEFLAAGRAAAKPGASARQMHKFRLLVKRHRYTVEILDGKTSGGLSLDTLRGLQGRLGAINDCVVTAKLMDDMALSAAAKRKIKAAVNRLIARRAADFRVYWREQFSRKSVQRRIT